jgi:mycofactocin precursor
MEPNSTINDGDHRDPEDRTVVPETETLVADELLVEDVSIDGMCGVY